MSSPPNFIDKRDLPREWEVVYFITNRCNSNCGHCWSKDTFLGKDMPMEWHRNFLNGLNYKRLKLIKLSGGETTLYKDIAGIIKIIRQNSNDIPIVIFSNGRFLFHNKIVFSIEEMIKSLNEIINGYNNIEIHISADEFHVKSYANQSNISFDAAVVNYNTMIHNLIEVTKIVKKEATGFNVKFKIHCDLARKSFHRELYAGISTDEWSTYFIVTEGLIKSGNAANLNTAQEIEPSNMWSAFLMPEAEFQSKKQDVGQKYIRDNEIVFLNKASDTGEGAVILGWWNLINKVYLGGSAYDFKRYLND